MLPAEARAFWVRAQAASARGDLAEAERAAEWVLRLDRGNPWAWLHVGELYLELGRADLAAEAAGEALARSTDLPEALRLQGRAALALRRPREAQVALERVRGLDVEADLVRALIAAGDLAGAEQRFSTWVPAASEALASAELALRLGLPGVALERSLALLDDPDHGPEAATLALEAGSRACALEGLHAWAASRLHRATDPRWRPALLAILERTGDLDHVARALRADPDPERYAELLVDQGRYDEALAWLGDASEAVVRGRVRVARGEAPEVAYAGVLEPRRTALLADAALARGDVVRALVLTDSATEASVLWVRAGALVLADRVEEAAQVAEASAADPLDAALRVARVRSLAGDVDGQQRALVQALEFDGCSVEARRQLAALGPPCASAAHLERAAAVRVADPVLREELGTARRACAAAAGGEDP